MAFLLPNLSPSLLQPKSKDKPFHPNQPFSPSQPTKSFSLSSSSPSPSSSAVSVGPALSSVQTPTVQGVEVDTPRDEKENQERDDFFVNLGLAVRTLREDMPLLFTKDLNYDIYRDDITFMDPLNTFTGIDNYKLIFWALRFHGKILFCDISLKVYRIWQPSENMILIRWNLKGVPRFYGKQKGSFKTPRDREAPPPPPPPSRHKSTHSDSHCLLPIGLASSHEHQPPKRIVILMEQV